MELLANNNKHPRLRRVDRNRDRYDDDSFWWRGIDDDLGLNAVRAGVVGHEATSVIRANSNRLLAFINRGYRAEAQRPDVYRAIFHDWNGPPGMPRNVEIRLEQTDDPDTIAYVGELSEDGQIVAELMALVPSSVLDQVQQSVPLLNIQENSLDLYNLPDNPVLFDQLVETLVEAHTNPLSAQPNYRQFGDISLN